MSRVLVDVDDTIIEVHGYAKQGAGFGYSGVRGLNALLATVTTAESAPVIVAQRLRKGSCGSPRGANRLVADALKTVASLSPASRPLVRADSAFYGRAVVGAALARRRRRVGHRAAGPRGQGRDRRDRRGRVDHDRVHRRRLRRTPPAAGSPAPRSPRSRFTAFTSQEEGRAGPRPARRRPRRCTRSESRRPGRSRRSRL